MSTQHFKSSITNFPVYLDGYLNVYEPVNSNETYPNETVKLILENIPFTQLSITDRNIIDSHRESIKLTNKIRTYQFKEITSLHYVEIDGQMYKVFNNYHFRNNEDFLESDITLEKIERKVDKYVKQETVN